MAWRDEAPMASALNLECAAEDPTGDRRAPAFAPQGPAARRGPFCRDGVDIGAIFEYSTTRDGFAW